MKDDNAVRIYVGSDGWGAVFDEDVEIINSLFGDELMRVVNKGGSEGDGCSFPDLQEVLNRLRQNQISYVLCGGYNAGEHNRYKDLVDD
ncbi:MAG: hypothetical protein ACI4CS_10970 [Candidatus Weimeria sp.]